MASFVWMLLTEPTYKPNASCCARLAGEDSGPESTTQRITLLVQPRRVLSSVDDVLLQGGIYSVERGVVPLPLGTRAAESSLRSAYKVLALQVELCLPRLIASCAEPRWLLRALDRGSGRRASQASLLLGAAHRVFCSDPLRLGLVAEPEPLADLRHQSCHRAHSTPFGSRLRAPVSAYRSDGHVRCLLAPLAG
jgi:hypothetical protein